MRLEEIRRNFKNTIEHGNERYTVGSVREVGHT
jgi:hypothetical protein